MKPESPWQLMRERRDRQRWLELREVVRREEQVAWEAAAFLDDPEPEPRPWPGGVVEVGRPFVVPDTLAGLDPVPDDVIASAKSLYPSLYSGPVSTLSSGEGLQKSWSQARIPSRTLASLRRIVLVGLRFLGLTSRNA